MKAWWGLGAAALSLVLIVFFWLPMLEGLPTVGRLSSKEAAPGIDVPVIGTVGDFPDPAHRHVVNATADGRLVLDGEVMEMPALLGELKRRGELDRGELIAGTERRLSNAQVVLRLDGSLPWRAAVVQIHACAEALIWQIGFAVRSESDGSERALAFQLPKDKGCEDPTDRVWKDVEVGPGPGGSPQALAAALALSPASLTGKLSVSLWFDPRTPTRVALQMIDVAIRSGAVSVRLLCGSPPRDAYAGFAAEVASLGSAGATYAVTLGGQVLVEASPSPAMTPVPRRSGVVLIPELNFGSSQHPADQLGSPLPLPPWPK